MNWQDFWTALALVLVLEGLLPFLTPAGYKRMINSVLTQPTQSIRLMGFILMILGTTLLFFLK